MFNIFDENFDWRQGCADRNPMAVTAESHARAVEVRRNICKTLTLYGRYGADPMGSERFYDKSGRLLLPDIYVNQMRQDDRMSVGEAMEMATRFARMAKEDAGTYLSVSQTPTNFFTSNYTYRGTPAYVPDMYFLNFMVSTTMNKEIDTREEWDMDVTYVRIDQYGQVKFANFTSAETSMRNYEYGAGIDLKWTWMETNNFGIKMNTLAPKFRFRYFDQISDAVTTAFLAAGVLAAANDAIPYNTSVIRTFNDAVVSLRRETRTFTGPDVADQTKTTTYRPFETSRLVVVCPWEHIWIWKAALAATLSQQVYQEELIQTPVIVPTAKLTNTAYSYVVVQGWEQNEYTTRVPLEAHGPVDDITTFSQKMTYRGAYGINIDSTSVRRLDFSTASMPTGMTFQIGETNWG